jgi:hypothetical protein
MGKGLINAYRILVGKSKWKKQLGRPERSSEYNIKIYIRDRGCGTVRAVAKKVMNFQIP